MVSEVARAKHLGAEIVFIFFVTDDKEDSSPFTVNTTRFPHGIAPVVKHIEANGMLAGFHTLPIVVPKRSSLRNHTDALVPEGLAPTFRSGCPMRHGRPRLTGR